MAKKKLFEFVIAFNPVEDKDDSAPATILANGFLLATDIDKAKTLASRRIPDSYVDKIEHVDVFVRPFSAGMP